MDVDAQDNRDFTPLHYAAAHGYTTAMECLIKKKAIIDAQEGDRFSLLHYAVQTGQLKAAQLLNQHGADVNITNTL